MSKRSEVIPKLTNQLRQIKPEWAGLRDIDIIEIVLREKLTPQSSCNYTTYNTTTH